MSKEILEGTRPQKTKTQSILKFLLIFLIWVYSPRSHYHPKYLYLPYSSKQIKTVEVYGITVPPRLFAIQLTCWVYKDITILGEFA